MTAARDEAENLVRLARCVAAQTRPPLEWIIVDDGSVDATAGIAADLARRHSWVRVLSAPAAAAAGVTEGRRTGLDRHRPSYLFLRSIWWARREAAAPLMLVGFVAAWRRHTPRAEASIRSELRARQRLRELPLRLAELLADRRLIDAR